MAQLIDELFLAAFDNEWLRRLNDQACFAVPGGRMVIATDSHVVSPLFFPGVDIGCLSVHGTINDVAMAGARPLYLAASFILEEGFPLGDLKRIVESMAAASREAGVPVITGDTKVVEQGKGDGVFITTTGVGIVRPRHRDLRDRARPGDQVLVSGTLATTASPSCRSARTSSSKRPSARTRPRCTCWWRAWSRRCRVFAACATPRAAGSPQR
jgi:hydrogenase expression/formation protein HypE